MYDHILYCGRKHFCRDYLQAFSTKEILKFHMNDCFKITGKHMIKMPENGQYVRFKNRKKIELLFIINADF